MKQDLTKIIEKFRHATDKIHYGKSKPNTEECYFDEDIEEWVESDSAQTKRIKEMIHVSMHEPRMITVDFKFKIEKGNA